MKKIESFGLVLRIFGLLLWVACFARADIDFVFDLDRVLIYQVKDPAEIQIKRSELVFTPTTQEYYRVAKGAREIIESLLELPEPIRISFFSGGSRVRNEEVLKGILLPSGQSFYDLAFKILSLEDVVTSKKEYLAQWKVPQQNLDPNSTSLEKRFFGKFHKNLLLVSKQIDLNRTIFVDDNIQFAYRGQEKNLLFVKEISRPLTSKEAIGNLTHFADSDEFSPFLKNKNQALEIDENKLIRARGLIEWALRDSKKNRVSLNDSLWNLQWKYKNNELTYNTQLLTDPNLYETGELNLRRPLRKKKAPFKARCLKDALPI